MTSRPPTAMQALDRRIRPGCRDHPGFPASWRRGRRWWLASAAPYAVFTLVTGVTGPGQPGHRVSGVIRHFAVDVLTTVGAVAAAPWVLVIWLAQETAERAAGEEEPSDGGTDPAATAAAVTNVLTVWRLIERSGLALSLIVSTSIFTTGTLRLALIGSGAVEPDAFPPIFVLGYGAFIAPVLVAALLPLVLACGTRALALVEQVLPPPESGLLGEELIAARARMEGQLHLEPVSMRNPLALLSVLSPFATAVVTTLRHQVTADRRPRPTANAHAAHTPDPTRRVPHHPDLHSCTPGRAQPAAERHRTSHRAGDAAWHPLPPRTEAPASARLSLHRICRAGAPRRDVASLSARSQHLRFHIAAGDAADQRRVASFYRGAVRKRPRIWITPPRSRVHRPGRAFLGERPLSRSPPVSEAGGQYCSIRSQAQAPPSCSTVSHLSWWCRPGGSAYRATTAPARARSAAWTPPVTPSTSARPPKP